MPLNRNNISLVVLFRVPPLLRLAASRYQQGEEKTATQKMTVKMFENE